MTIVMTFLILQISWTVHCLIHDHQSKLDLSNGQWLQSFLNIYIYIYIYIKWDPSHHETNLLVVISPSIVPTTPPSLDQKSKSEWGSLWRGHGLLIRYVKFRVVHAHGMPATFSPPPRASDPDMHHGTCHGTCVTHVPWCMAGSLASGFLWNRWRGKRSRHSRHMHPPKCYVRGKRPIVETIWELVIEGRQWRAPGTSYNHMFVVFLFE